MELVTAEQGRQLMGNWNMEGDAVWPVVKIFSPVSSATGLIASMNPQDEDTMYGLWDLGVGDPELGYVRLSELQSMTVRVWPGSVGIGLEQDLYFDTGHLLSTYAEAARRNGAITDGPELLDAVWDRR